MKIEDYNGPKQDELEEILEYLLNLSLDMRGTKMLEDLVEQAVDKLKDLYEMAYDTTEKESEHSKDLKEQEPADEDENEVKRRISHESNRLK